MRGSIFAIIAVITLQASAYADTPLETSCLGPVNAKRFMIYLHGMDTPAPSAQEQENRSILSNLADTYEIRIALPRAKMACPTQAGLLCWGWAFDSKELSEIIPLIVSSRTNCFPEDTPFEMLGFSNGGYLLTHWYSNGMSPISMPSPFSMIASGSAVGQVPSNTQSLADNPKLTLIVGEQDQFNNDPSETLFHQLQNDGAKVQLIEFQGGHVLNQAALSEALEN